MDAFQEPGIEHVVVMGSSQLARELARRTRFHKHARRLSVMTWPWRSPPLRQGANPNTDSAPWGAYLRGPSSKVEKGDWAERVEPIEGNHQPPRAHTTRWTEFRLSSADAMLVFVIGIGAMIVGPADLLPASRLAAHVLTGPCT